MLEWYYDEKAKEFNDLQLETLTMDEFVTKFVNLQCYVPCLKEEKAKVYSFISCLLPTYKENI